MTQSFKVGDLVRRIGKNPEVCTVTAVRRDHVIVEIDRGQIILHCSLPTYDLAHARNKETDWFNWRAIGAELSSRR